MNDYNNVGGDFPPEFLQSPPLTPPASTTGPSLPPFPPRISDYASSEQLRAKEVILICLALLLLVCSVLLFFKHWKKNYRDINQLPYYAYLYQKEAAEFVGTGAVAGGGAAATAMAGSLPPQPPSSQAAVSETDMTSPKKQTEHWDLISSTLPPRQQLQQQQQQQQQRHQRFYPKSSLQNLSNLLDDTLVAQGPGAAAASGTRRSTQPRLVRSHSVRTYYKLSSVVQQAAAAVPTIRHHYPPQSRRLARTGTDPALLHFPVIRRPDGPPSTALLMSAPQPSWRNPSSLSGGPPRPFLVPKMRAASDVYGRFSKCRHDIMRRINSELEEEDGPKLEEPNNRNSAKSPCPSPNVQAYGREEDQGLEQLQCPQSQLGQHQYQAQPTLPLTSELNGDSVAVEQMTNASPGVTTTTKNTTTCGSVPPRLGHLASPSSSPSADQNKIDVCDNKRTGRGHNSISTYV